VDPIDLAFLEGDDIRAALRARDIGTLYRHLRRLGFSQRHLADLTGQSQSEVSEILRSRQVMNVWVIERIADGLGIPRGWLGVGYCDKEAPGEEIPADEVPEEPPGEQEVDEDVKRRVVIALTMAVALNRELPDRPELALPAEEELPPQLEMFHVHIVRAVRDQLVSLSQYYGGQGDLWTSTAKHYTRWMKAPGPEAVKLRLAAALSELHTRAGWCCYDSGRDGSGHFARALSLAHQAKDSYCIAYAACCNGVTMVRSGRPNDALKQFQLGQIHLGGFRLRSGREEDRRLPTLISYLDRNSATAYGVMGDSKSAELLLTRAHEGWEPGDAADRGLTHGGTAGVWLDLAQFDAAEASATKALRSYGENHRVPRAMTEVLLAEVYLRAGEAQGLALAHQAIEKVSTLQSFAARRERLIPLATALEARPGTDRRDLARKARQIATTPI